MAFGYLWATLLVIFDENMPTCVENTPWRRGRDNQMAPGMIHHKTAQPQQSCTCLSSEGVEKRRLSAARGSHDRKQSPGPGFTAHAMQDPSLTVTHRKRNVLSRVVPSMGRGGAGVRGGVTRRPG